MTEVLHLGHVSTVPRGNPPFDICLASGRIRCGSAEFTAPNREVLLLNALNNAYPKGLRRNALFYAVYGERFDYPESNCLDSHLSKLRRRMREAGVPFTPISRRYLGVCLEPVPP